MAALRRVTMISKDAQFMEEEVKDLIDSCEPDSPCRVISIIGPQCTGKSTLLNSIFGTEFEVLDTCSSVLWNQTTKGVLIGVSKNPRAIVIDTEGWKPQALQQGNEGFDNQSALFALTASDFTLVNLNDRDVNHLDRDLLFTTCLKEVVKHELRITMVFAIRRYEGRYPPSAYHNQIIMDLEKIWDQIPQRGERLIMTNHVKIFVHVFHELRSQEYVQECEAMGTRIASGEFDGDSGMPNGELFAPARTFPSRAFTLWEVILGNKRLIPLPCEFLKSWRHLESTTKDLLRMLETDKFPVYIKCNYKKKCPKCFLVALDNILSVILHRYDKEASGYYRLEGPREELTRSVMNVFKGKFKNCLERAGRAFIEKNKKDIAKNLDRRLMPRKKAHREIEMYSRRFDDQVLKGLQHFDKEIRQYQRTFIDDLSDFTNKEAVAVVARRWASLAKGTLCISILAGCGAIVIAFVFLIKFGSPVAVTCVGLSLPFIDLALRMFRPKSSALNIISTVTQFICGILHQSFNLFFDLARPFDSSVQEKLISIVETEASASKESREFVTLVIQAVNEFMKRHKVAV